jgi:hypothetical protein
MDGLVFGGAGHKELKSFANVGRGVFIGGGKLTSPRVRETDTLKTGAEHCVLDTVVVCWRSARRSKGTFPLTN